MFRKKQFQIMEGKVFLMSIEAKFYLLTKFHENQMNLNKKKLEFFE